jgi:hypothetical protein
MSDDFKLVEVTSVGQFVQLIKNDLPRKVERIMKIQKLDEYKKEKEELCSGLMHHDPSDAWPWIEAFGEAEKQGILERLQ